MLIRVPDYYEAFHCLAGACPHTCCEKWEVVIDPETARRYGTVPGPLGERLRAAMGPDEDGDLCFRLDGGRCPFLDRENLCEIHRALGEAATSVTCREHPRLPERGLKPGHNPGVNRSSGPYPSVIPGQIVLHRPVFPVARNPGPRRYTDRFLYKLW